MLDSENEISDKNNKVLTNAEGNVSLKDVEFSYTPDRELIKGLSLNVKKGQQIGSISYYCNGVSVAYLQITAEKDINYKQNKLILFFEIFKSILCRV